MVAMATSYPKVSVLMAVYNGERFLRQAIDSILGQTLTDFEFLIINDGSTDSTWQILEDYADKDKRLVLLQNRENIGLAKSLNRGLKIACGEYIARMDVDDISLPNRLDAQVSYLDAHPEIGVVGSFIQWMEEDGSPGTIWHTPTSDALIKWSLCFHTPLAHPSVMYRKTLIEQVGGYDEKFLASQDRDLWQRLSSITRFANLPEVYLKYRKHHLESVSHRYKEEQIINSARAGQRMLEAILEREIPFDISYHIRLGKFDTANKALRTADLILSLYHAFSTREKLSIAESYSVRTDAAQRIYRFAQPWLADKAVRSQFLLKIFCLTPLLWARIATRRLVRSVWRNIKR